ncbi:MAG TPA: hypothetical protein VIX18_11340 [Nitrospirota bacterium]
MKCVVINAPALPENAYEAAGEDREQGVSPVPMEMLKKTGPEMIRALKKLA